MNYLKQIVLVWTILAWSAFPCLAANAPRPNILLILADDLGYADTGFQGSKEIKTPRLDTLASLGTTFSAAYVVHPFCGPSRMGLLAGRYPYKFGAPFNLPDYSLGAYRDEGIPTNETLISTVLQRAGYRTGLMGKWHLGQQPEQHPNKRGFDEFYGFLGGGILYFGPYQAQNAAGTTWDYKVYPQHNGVNDTTLTASDYMTDVLTRKGVDFIKDAAKKKDKPFFLFMSYNAPHTVLAAKAEDMALFPTLQGKRKIYAAMVYALDRGVGELVDALKATGQYENTLIIFLSDNGGRTDEGASNSPLKGAKGDTWEGGWRVPMFFHWPNVVKAGQRYEYPVSALDFYPTFARLAGAAIPDAKDLDGKEIWEDFLAGRNPRQGDFLYTIRYRPDVTDVGAIENQWKLVHANNKWKLFNIKEDIGEVNDLSETHPEPFHKMIDEFRKASQSHVQPKWFDSKKAELQWNKNGMPHYETLFPAKD